MIVTGNLPYYQPLDFAGYPTLLDYFSLYGKSQDYSGNTLTGSNVTFVRNGRNKSAKFNGSGSIVDTGTDMVGTKAVTVMGWIKAYGWGEMGYGRIVDNGINSLVSSLMGDGTARVSLRSGGISNSFSANNSISLNKLQFVAVTRTAAGVTNFYIGDKNTAPALSGSADQDSGTPAVGANNVFIGNKNDGTRTFDGLIQTLKIVEGILPLEQIKQFSNYSKLFL